MELLLQTTTFTEESTESTLFVDGVQECYTLELPVKDGKPGSAIPSGVYDVKLMPSPKFEQSTDPWVMKYAKLIPHILGIPEEYNRSNILMHWGNDVKDTEGCVLTGEKEDPDFIENSRLAFSSLHEKLMTDKDNIKLTVVDRTP